MALIISGLAALMYRPDETWLRQYAGHVAQLLPGMSQMDKKVIGRSFLRLGFEPDHPQIVQLVAAAAAAAVGFSDGSSPPGQRHAGAAGRAARSGADAGTASVAANFTAGSHAVAASSSDKGAAGNSGAVGGSASVAAGDKVRPVGGFGTPEMSAPAAGNLNSGSGISDSGFADTDEAALAQAHAHVPVDQASAAGRHSTSSRPASSEAVYHDSAAGEVQPASLPPSVSPTTAVSARLKLGKRQHRLQRRSVGKGGPRRHVHTPNGDADDADNIFTPSTATARFRVAEKRRQHRQALLQARAARIRLARGLPASQDLAPAASAAPAAESATPGVDPSAGGLHSQPQEGGANRLALTLAEAQQLELLRTRSAAGWAAPHESGAPHAAGAGAFHAASAAEDGFELPVLSGRQADDWSDWPLDVSLVDNDDGDSSSSSAHLLIQLGAESFLLGEGGSADVMEASRS